MTVGPLHWNEKDSRARRVTCDKGVNEFARDAIVPENPTRAPWYVEILVDAKGHAAAAGSEVIDECSGAVLAKDAISGRDTGNKIAYEQRCSVEVLTR
jgi:hypothetical protein